MLEFLIVIQNPFRDKIVSPDKLFDSGKSSKLSSDPESLFTETSVALT